MEITLKYFLERLPIDFLISSVFLFGVLSLSTVFLIVYEFMNPVKQFGLVISALSSRLLMLFSIVLLYSSFMASHQFQIPILPKSTSLVFSSISFILLSHSHFFVIFYSPKQKHTLSAIETMAVVLSTFVLYALLPEKTAYFLVSILFVISIMYHGIQAWSISTDKLHAILSIIYSLMMLSVFVFRIGYIYGYTPTVQSLRWVNEHSAFIFVGEVLTYLSYFSYSDKSTLYIFSKNMDLKSSKNVIKISKNDIITKRLSIW